MSVATKHPRVFLTGFSGTGKSTFAPLVAEALGWRALDTDTLVEQAAGKSIPEIFASDGEARFRELERDAIARAAKEDNVVVAAGGGALIDVENRRAMADGLVVCLEAKPQTIVELLGDAGDGPERPLLADGGDPLARIIELKAQRQRYYALADVIIETDGKTTDEIVAAGIEATRANDPWFSGQPERLLLPNERASPPSSEPVWVETASRRYAAHVGWGLLDNLGELLRAQGIDDGAWIVSDSEVLPRHGDRALHALRSAGLRAEAFAIPAGEASKRLDVAATVYDWLVAQRAERGHAIVALGGGVVGDLAGFVAATYLRGMPLVMAPTSVLSMVDASIGGKVAVDHAQGKNLIGTFYQPSLVIDDVSLLKTLPRRMVVEGFAEAIKHALILSPELLTLLGEHADDLLHIEPAVTVDIVRRNVAIKASVVSQDERDTGLRAILNYGHTLGHAIEAVGGYTKVLHGAADAIGMTAAAEIGRRIGVTPPAVVERQRAVLERFGLPAKAPPGIDPERVLESMMLDKKVVGGTVHWVLLEDVGRAVVRSNVPPEIVRDVVADLLRA
jgi:3-dehydroquinate synthase